MSCNSNCFVNCDHITSDQCVQYTGPDIPALGICQGDQVSSVEQVIITELVGALQGTGIEPENVTLENCQWLADQFVNEDPNLSNLLQLLIDSSCSLKAMIDGINAKLVPQATSFNTLCIQGLPANPNSNDILQGVINTLCSLSSVVSAFPTTYVKASDITSIVQQQITIYLSQSQTGQIEYFNYFPLGVGFPYFGSLASFDNTGKGLPSAGMTNLYLANGLNGTPDLRGRTLVGAVRNVPGGTLDVAVDPANVNNPNWALLDKNGENKHLNTVAETASHTHVVTDPGHTHDLTFKNMLPVKGGGNTAVPTLGSNPNFPITIPAAAISDTTGITIATTGGSQPHNNIQPSIACNWVIRMV